MWLLPLSIVGLAAMLSVPLGRIMARILDRREAGNRVERLLDTGPQDWKRYCFAMLAFNAAAFAVGFVTLSLQPLNPEFLNPDGKGMLSPVTIFNTACSFVSNTNLQHYSGEVHISYGTVLFFTCWKNFITPAIGLAALLAVIRGLRGDPNLGNFYLDVWRGVLYVFLPLSLIMALMLVAGGVPMTLEGNENVTTLEGAKQTISRGPVAAIVAIKQLGTNGGGFFGANSAHPFENPSAWTNLLECVAIILVPMACVVLLGKMLNAGRHAVVLFAVMLLFLGAFIGWGVATDTLSPNRAFTANPAVEGESGTTYRVGLPIEQTGNLEGKELRFGPSAETTWAACTTATSNGSVNCMHDSLAPLAGLAPLSGMWLNCIFGGVGVGLINFLVYLIVAVFLAGLMVGRTPEYLGKKVEAREMKLAMLALLIHPVMILVPTGLFAVLDWGAASTSNPGPHGMTQILYEFTSASANNGSGFEGLGDTWGFNDPKANPSPPAPFSREWDIATGLIMLLCRFIPIIAPIALAASLSAKKPTPFTAGTLRTDTATFGMVLLGTIILVGALLFLPVAALGPIAEHLGPLPFGG